VPRGTVGRLAVRGPTGCRYLADDRQNGTMCRTAGTSPATPSQDEDGYLHFAARNDDMIVSSGYNIAGPEVEAALLAHPAVAECAVIGAPDEARGQIVQAHVVLRAGGLEGSEVLVKALAGSREGGDRALQVSRAVVFCDALPKTETGKIQRFRLREAR
jgi:2-aminobenzoate-CoA ligase